MKKEDIAESIKTYTQMKSIYKIETKKRCENLALNFKMSNEYGLERQDLLPAFIELFYRKGKEDALKELKVSLKLNDIEQFQKLDRQSNINGL